MDDPRRWIQAISFITATVTFVIVLWRMRHKNTVQRYICIMPLVFLLHTAVYYAAVFWLDFGRALMPWSAGLHLHGLITIVILAYIAAASLKTNA